MHAIPRIKVSKKFQKIEEMAIADNIDDDDVYVDLYS
jgi:hypothetical protein